MDQLQNVLQHAQKFVQDLNIPKYLASIQPVVDSVSKTVNHQLKNFDTKTTHEYLTKDTLVQEVFFAVMVVALSTELIRRRGRRSSPIYVILATLVAAASGDTLSSVLLGKAPLWLTNDKFVALAAGIAAVNSFGLHLIVSFGLFRFLGDSVLALYSVNCLVAGYNLGYAQFHTLTAALVIGTMWAAGRYVVLDLERLLWNEPVGRTNRPYEVHLYLALGILYSVLVNNVKLANSEAYVVISAIALVWNLLRYVVGPFSFFAPAETFLGLFHPEPFPTGYVLDDNVALVQRPAAVPSQQAVVKPQVAAKPQAGNTKAKANKGV